MTCRSGQKRFWNQKRLYSFVFLYVCSKFMTGSEAVLTIVELEFFDIFYSKFQLVSAFSICSKFCVENWHFCCDLSCKWVTCRSGCKRFWKSALQLLCELNQVTCNPIQINLWKYPLKKFNIPLNYKPISGKYLSAFKVVKIVMQHPLIYIMGRNIN